jgi:phosphatidate cytidylyltransferase
MSTELRQRKAQASSSVVGSTDQKSNANTTSKDQQPEEERKPSPMEIVQEKYRKFFTRSFWGILMIIVFAMILWLGHVAVSAFVIFLQIMVFKEMLAIRYSEAKERNLWGFRTLHW